MVPLKDLVPTKIKLQARSLTDALWCSQPGQEEHQAAEQAHPALISMCPHQALPPSQAQAQVLLEQRTLQSQKRTLRRGFCGQDNRVPGVCI